MGGEAAKERRRLKRLEAQQSASATTSTPSMEKKSDDAPIQQTIKNGEKSNADTLLRFKRKMARKASGKFKPQSQGQSDDVTSHNKLSPAKRKSEEYTNNNRRTSTYPPSKKAFKGSPRQNQQSNQQQKKPPFKRNNNANNSTSPRYNKKDNSKQSLKKKNTTQKVKKPKHLKRKMDQLSKTISEGNTIVDLEDQMQQLAAQMEEYKRLKKKSDNLVVTEDVGKKSPANSKEDYDAKDNNKRSGEKGVQNSQKDGRSSGTEKNEESSGDTDFVQDTKLEKSNDKQVKCDEKQNAASSSSGSSSSSSDNGNSSDSDDDSDIVPSNNRSRGKRRRGRRDNTKQKEDVDDTVVTLEKSQENQNKTDLETKDNVESTEPATKKTPKKDDKRRCIGRKALTDYTVGKAYSGTVKYIKPKLGAFIDIGSHSDVFVHISFISNEFVSSINDDILKVGDVIDNVRVIEIDREKKRITGSLRSKDMAESEKERLESTRQFENNKSRGSNNKYSERKGSGWGGDRNNSSSMKEEHVRFDADDTRAKAITESSVSKHDYIDTTESQVQSRNAVISPSRSGEKSAADLKRERKLARRAERRAAKEASNQ